jgi:thiol-disulfide isomerase/thioredoxin
VGLQAAAIALLVALVALFAQSVLQGSATVSAELGDGKRPQAPNFTLPRLNGGGDVSLQSFRGKVVLLNFWASWCAPCREEASLLNQIQSHYGPRGVVVVGVDSQDFTSAARTFAREQHGDGDQPEKARPPHAAPAPSSGRIACCSMLPVTSVTNTFCTAPWRLITNVTGKPLETPQRLVTSFEESCTRV